MVFRAIEIVLSAIHLEKGRTMHHLSAELPLRLYAALCARIVTARQNHQIRVHHLADERGDVPGWVLVAVMTAGLVTAIWLIADDRLTGVLDGAISSVATP